jgi:hypothetical protein
VSALDGGEIWPGGDAEGVSPQDPNNGPLEGETMHVLESCRNAVQDLAANTRRVGRLLEAPEAGELAMAEQGRTLLALGRIAERVERLADGLERRLGWTGSGAPDAIRGNPNDGEQ